VFDALADAHTYPEWWSAVYLKVEGDRTLGVGAVTRLSSRAGSRTT
jgi:hypothetical protein